MKRTLFGCLLAASVMWPAYAITRVQDVLSMFIIYSFVFCGALGMGALVRLRPVSEKTKQAEIEKMAQAIFDCGIILEIDGHGDDYRAMPWTEAVVNSDNLDIAEWVRQCRENAEAAWKAINE